MAQLWKGIWQFLKKINMDLPYPLASLLLGISSGEVKARVCINTGTRMFIRDLFIIAQNWIGYNKWLQFMFYPYTEKGVNYGYIHNTDESRNNYGTERSQSQSVLSYCVVPFICNCPKYKLIESRPPVALEWEYRNIRSIRKLLKVTEIFVFIAVLV